MHAEARSRPSLLQVGREFESRMLARAPAAAAASLSVEAEAERYTAEASVASR